MSKRKARGDYQRHAKRQAIGGGYRKVYTPRVKAMDVVVPGITRTEGRYARARLAAGAAPQKKYFDTGYSATSIDANGTILTSPCLVPGGSTDTTRVGNKINICNFDIKISFSLDKPTNITAGILSNNVRMILYVDKQTNGAAATPANILTGASPTIFSFRNMDTVDRFRILADKYYNLEPKTAVAIGALDNTANISAAVGAFRMIRKSFKLNLPVHYDGVTGAITELKSNNLGILLITNVTGTNFSANARIKYYDA